MTRWRTLYDTGIEKRESGVTAAATWDIAAHGIDMSSAECGIGTIIGVLADRVRVRSERLRLKMVDTKGVGNPSVLQNEGSRFYEQDKKIEDWLALNRNLK